MKVGFEADLPIGMPCDILWRWQSRKKKRVVVVVVDHLPRRQHQQLCPPKITVASITMRNLPFPSCRAGLWTWQRRLWVHMVLEARQTAMILKSSCNNGTVNLGERYNMNYSLSTQRIHNHRSFSRIDFEFGCVIAQHFMFYNVYF